MYTNSSLFTILREIPNVITIQDNKLLYRGTPLFSTDYTQKVKSCLTANCISFVRNSYPEEQFSSHDDLTNFVIAHLCDLEKIIPSMFFKNGSIRLAAKIKLQKGFKNASVSIRNPLFLNFQTQIKQRWNSLPQTTKEALKPFCDETGTFVPTFAAQVLLDESGNYQTQFIRTSTHELCNDFLRSYLGTVYIKRTQDIKRKETIDQVEYSFNPLEWAWFTLKFNKCITCGKWKEKETFVFGQCSDCSSCSNLQLDSYSTRATDRFDAIITKFSKYSSHLLGIELEYEQKEKLPLKETLFLLNKHLKEHAIFKRDGSLTNGVEICTRPASADIHLKELLKVYHDPLIWERLEVKPTCGMHIHIDRRTMSALTLGKLINFMQKKDNQSFIETIAERSSNSYSKLGTNLSVTSMIRGFADTDRYQGINVQNRHTAELRIFKTPSTYKSFQKNVEFTSALTSFVQPANSGIKESGYGEFLTYVKTNRSTYQELYKFTKENF